MKSCYIFLAYFFISSILFGQNLTFYGNVKSFYGDKNHKIYYTFDSAKIDLNQYLNFTERYEYKISFNLKKLKKKRYSKLHFYKDTAQSLKNEYYCIHTINLDSILQNNAFKTLNSIQLYNDIYVDRNCQITIYRNAEEENLTKFVGEYDLFLNNKRCKLILTKNLDYELLYYSNDNDLMNLEIGHWDYYKNDEHLVLYSEIFTNRKFNTFKIIEHSYKFDVFDRGNKVSLIFNGQR